MLKNGKKLYCYYITYNKDISQPKVNKAKFINLFKRVSKVTGLTGLLLDVSAASKSDWIIRKKGYNVTADH